MPGYRVVCLPKRDLTSPLNALWRYPVDQRERVLLQEAGEALLPFLVEHHLRTGVSVERVCAAAAGDQRLWVLALLHAELPAMVEEAAELSERTIACPGKQLTSTSEAGCREHQSGVAVSSGAPGRTWTGHLSVVRASQRRRSPVAPVGSAAPRVAVRYSARSWG